ncbi:MAG: lnt [Chlamydiales bacterium]|jgi:apolipoprotein N-acyltransferase|nr:lnt [Chlamydiales bacterium]
MNTYLLRLLSLVFSWLIVAYGQEANYPILGPIAAIFGYTLFWAALPQDSPKRTRFILSLVWYIAVQLVQFSWFGKHYYSELYLYAAYGILVTAMAFQFAVFTNFIPLQLYRWKLYHFLVLPGFWVLLELMRLLPMTGSTWSPAGLALASTLPGAQLAAIGGVYLLSYWVILTNLLTFYLWQRLVSTKTDLRMIFVTFFFLALTPYLYGWGHIGWHQHRIATQSNDLKKIDVVLLDTHFTVPEKHAVSENWQQEMIHPLEQWRSMLQALKPLQHQKIDLLLLPEGAFPFDLCYPFYSFAEMEKIFFEETGAIFPLPDLVAPWVFEKKQENKSSIWGINNGYLAQVLALWLSTEVVIGLGDDGIYNSAFHFAATGELRDRYAKRVLVPMGEYIPYDWVKELSAIYGVYDSFQVGEKAQIFKGATPMGISICYEETYGHLMRENRHLGAEVLLNLTSDVWFPNSGLDKQHLAHARLRTVENGFPLLRSCNMGISAVIDAVGESVKYDQKTSSQQNKVHAFYYANLPIYHYSTLYTYWGDYFISGISLLGMLLGLIQSRRFYH